MYVHYELKLVLCIYTLQLKKILIIKLLVKPIRIASGVSLLGRRGGHHVQTAPMPAHQLHRQHLLLVPRRALLFGPKSRSVEEFVKYSERVNTKSIAITIKSRPDYWRSAFNPLSTKKTSL